MKGSYSVYVIFPKTIKPPEHLETNLAPSPPPKNIDHADKKLISLGIYATSMCNPLKKTSSPRKNVNVFFFQPHPPPPLHESILTATARSQSLELIIQQIMMVTNYPFQKSQLFQKQFEFDPSRKQS